MNPYDDNYIEAQLEAELKKVYAENARLKKQLAQVDEEIGRLFPAITEEEVQNAADDLVKIAQELAA